MTTASADIKRSWQYPIGHAQARMERLAERLSNAYGTPNLGNVSDPLDECIYILTTYQTDLPRAQLVFDHLRRTFPTWEALMDGARHKLEDVLRPSGFQRSRAGIIRKLLAAVKARFGVYSLEALRAMSAEDAERELRALPGLDFKGARCVMLYSLGKRVLPVDSNTFRFMGRYGVLAKTARYRRRTTHDGLQRLVPEDARYALHVNLVVHGQTTCLPRTPKCSTCCVRETCSTGRSRA